MGLSFLKEKKDNKMINQVMTSPSRATGNRNVMTSPANRDFLVVGAAHQKIHEL
jgi:hypothetical protein